MNATAPKPAGDPVLELLQTELSERYREPHRAYHNLHHVHALLHWCEQCVEQLHEPDCVRWSIWLHDAVYDPERKDNEMLSAELARQLLTRAGVSADKIVTVVGHILSTIRHEWRDGQSDSAYFLDFDLSILGAEVPEYRRYTEAIRREYGFVPDDAYAQGRSAILTRFLERDTLYVTEAFQTRFEQRARQNIAQELQRLAAPCA